MRAHADSLDIALKNTVRSSSTVRGTTTVDAESFGEPSLKSSVRMKIIVIVLRKCHNIVKCL